MAAVIVGALWPIGGGTVKGARAANGGQCQAEDGGGGAGDLWEELLVKYK